MQGCIGVRCKDRYRRQREIYGLLDSMAGCSGWLPRDLLLTYAVRLPYGLESGLTAPLLYDSTTLITRFPCSTVFSLLNSTTPRSNQLAVGSQCICGLVRAKVLRAIKMNAPFPPLIQTSSPVPIREACRPLFYAQCSLPVAQPIEPVPLSGCRMGYGVDSSNSEATQLLPHS